MLLSPKFWQVSGSNWLCTDAYRADRRRGVGLTLLIPCSHHHLIFILPIYLFCPSIPYECCRCTHPQTALVGTCGVAVVILSYTIWVKWAHCRETEQWSHQIELDRFSKKSKLKHYPSADERESLDATYAAQRLWMTSPLILRNLKPKNNSVYTLNDDKQI